MTARISAVPAKVKSFYDYFLLSADVGQVLAALGYGYQSAALQLPRTDTEADTKWVEALAERLRLALPRLVLSNETATREFLIAPLLLELVINANVTVHTEYAVNAGANLKGSLDYLLEGRENLIVVEAKQGDLYRGFRQLAAEMVAVDQSIKSEATHLYGAITVGDVWRFAVLDRSAKIVSQDINLWRVPADLKELSQTLLGILNGQGSGGAVETIR